MISNGFNQILTLCLPLNIETWPESVLEHGMTYCRPVLPFILRQTIESSLNWFVTILLSLSPYILVLTTLSLKYNKREKYHRSIESTLVFSVLAGSFFSLMGGRRSAVSKTTHSMIKDMKSSAIYKVSRLLSGKAEPIQGHLSRYDKWQED